ncbi:MAG: alpha/beta fold hydrolase [Kiritimatiellales bacterium]
MSLIVRIIFICALLYAGILCWMWIRQEKFLFQPKHENPPAAFEHFRWDRTIDGFWHEGWFIDKKKPVTVIYHGGNAEDLANHVEIMFNGLDANVLMINYRGYGLSAGKPGEKVMVSDAIQLYDLFRAETGTPAEQLFLMGRSLGTGIAVQVAAARPSAGLILVTPYAKIEDAARFQYPFLPPLNLLLRHRFRSIDYVTTIQTPALILLAAHDEMIPLQSGETLAEIYAGTKKIITLPTGHMDIHEIPEYFAAMNKFIKSAGSVRAN